LSHRAPIGRARSSALAGTTSATAFGAVVVLTLTGTVMHAIATPRHSGRRAYRPRRRVETGERIRGSACRLLAVLGRRRIPRPNAAEPFRLDPGNPARAGYEEARKDHVGAQVEARKMLQEGRGAAFRDPRTSSLRLREIPYRTRGRHRSTLQSQDHFYATPIWDRYCAVFRGCSLRRMCVWAPKARRRRT
jgi:hypothetical protein